MMKIGEFSKLTQLTVKALRFYEKEGLLTPAHVDEWTGYRFYLTDQLEQAAKIKSYRRLDLSIEEIRAILNGKNERAILEEKVRQLTDQQKQIDGQLASLRQMLEGTAGGHAVTVKTIPVLTVCYTEQCLARYSDMMQLAPAFHAELNSYNPGIRYAEPHYEFTEYLDGEYKERDIRIRYTVAVRDFGSESENVKFKKLPAVKVLSTIHKGAYDEIGGAYAHIMHYAEENGYSLSALSRECYIDGIWNTKSVEDWRTEIQLPVG